MTVIHLPYPPPPGSAARLPCIVGRAFTPAGKEVEEKTWQVCVSAATQSPAIPQGGEVRGNPEGYW